MRKKGSEISVTTTSLEKRLAKFDITEYECNEFEFSRLFHDVYGSSIKYVAVSNEYYLYNPNLKIWEIDRHEKVKQMAERFLSRDCPLLINNISDVDVRKAYNRWIKNRQCDAAGAAILKCARRKEKIVASQSDFDRMARYFALKNGALDMKTNTVVLIRRSYLISKHANALFDHESADTTWRDFLLSIFSDDVEMYEYILRAIGYAMQGDGKAHCLFMLYGPLTRNGKSTFVRAIGEFFNDYGVNLSQNSLSLFKNDPGKPRPDIVSLKGKRFVAVAELPKAMKFDYEFLKSATGEDPVTARILYHNDAENFTIHGIFFMHMNRLPVIEDVTLFDSNRIIVIPFNRHFGIKTADTELYSKLITEEAFSGLLNEIIRVRKKYSGISVKDQLPTAVERATLEYADSCDCVGSFLKTKLLKSSGGWISTSEIYTAYQAFANSKNEIPVTQQMLSRKIKRRGCKIKRTHSGNGVYGYKLKS